MTTGVTSTSSSAVTYTASVLATEDTIIGNLINLSSANQIIINDSERNAIGTISISSTMTIKDLFNQLEGYGLKGYINDGIIYIDSESGNYITGSATEALGIDVIEKVIAGSGSIGGGGGTSTVAITVTSSENILINENMTLNSMGARIYGLMKDINRLSQTEAETLGYTWVTTASVLHNALANNRNVMLGNDIDLSSFNWESIAEYTGTFNGNGYALTGYSGTDGLFETLRAGATVQNLIMNDFNIYETSHGNYTRGVLANSIDADTTIDNITFNNAHISLVNNWYSYAGIVAGQCRGSDSYNKNMASQP